MYENQESKDKADLERAVNIMATAFPEMIICETTVKAVLARAVAHDVSLTWNDGKEAALCEIEISK